MMPKIPEVRKRGIVVVIVVVILITIMSIMGNYAAVILYFF